MSHQLAAELIDENEAKARSRLWGHSAVRYERRYHEFGRWRRRFYSDAVLNEFDKIDCLATPPLRADRLDRRHQVHQRSYIDIKLRLADHLLGDHGDRMGMANSVEGRFPFLDKHMVAFARSISPDLKVNGLDEKVIVKLAASRRIPQEVVRREKFGFRAPGSPSLLKVVNPYIEELLDSRRIEKQGYFNAAEINKLVEDTRKNGSKFNPHAQDDLLLIAITFGVFLDVFNMPDL
ncbi:hypothetical protein ASC93_00890 [Massilia sp. Root335]|nr:hypothetical protein ASC93_00890 [Massilia sp. Root335]